jgi:Flp pilus assembly protein TadD
MSTFKTVNSGYPCRCAAALLAAAMVLSACATTEPARAPVRIQIDEDVGFTITEETGVDADVREDYQVALMLLERGQYDEGMALLESVAAVAPELSAPRIDLGIAYHSAGNLEAAEANLLKALASNPDHPIAHNELGIVYRKAGRFAEARKSYEAALAIYPGYHYARRNLAILCDLYLADLACALENYEAYMAAVTTDQEASMWISDIRSRLGR